MMRSYSAPAKVILFGEHAVVFGEPAISAAIDLRSRVTVRDSAENLLNGMPLRRDSSPYAFHALELTESSPMEITVESAIPAGGGLGSSAAFSVSLVASLLGNGSPGRVAELAFNVELRSQGRASPIDTSTAVHGQGIFVSRETVANELWQISGPSGIWHIGDIRIGRMNIVIGYSGQGAATGPMVERVRKLCERFEVAREAISEIGSISLEAKRALERNDIVTLGSLMDRNQKLLSVVGVSTRRLEKLIQAVAPYSYGAKLTGAGGGGSIIALTDRPEKAAGAISLLGGVPYICRTGETGLRREEDEG